jgi:hypothetical protein
MSIANVVLKMSTVNVVLSFVGGTAVGAVVTAIITANQDRTERFRERMITAAGDFLAACQEATSAIVEFVGCWKEFHDESREVASAKEGLHRAIRAAQLRDSAATNEETDRLMAAAVAVTTSLERLDVWEDLIARDPSRHAKPIIDTIGKAIEAPISCRAVAELRELLDQTSGAVSACAAAGRRTYAEFVKATTAMNRAHDLIPRLRLLFAGSPRGGRLRARLRGKSPSTDVVKLAETAEAKLFAIRKEFIDQLDKHKGPGDELAVSSKELLKPAEDAISELAAAVNQIVRRYRL